MFNQFQIDECLGGRHARYGPDLGVEQFQEFGIVGADDFDECVEVARGQHHIRNRVDFREPFSHLGGVALTTDADHCLPAEPQLHRVGDRDDVHHPGINQPLHPLAHRGLRQPHLLADPRIGAATIALEFLDDGLGHLVDRHRFAHTYDCARISSPKPM